MIIKTTGTENRERILKAVREKKQITPPLKDTVWQTALKRKIRQCVFYKGPILLTEINTGLG
jgi:hypothetical protein